MNIESIQGSIPTKRVRVVNIAEDRPVSDDLRSDGRFTTTE